MPLLLSCIVPHPPIIVPELGRGREKEAVASIVAFRQLATRMAALEPESVILVSPHRPAYADAFVIGMEAECKGNLAAFGAPEPSIRTRLDPVLAQAIGTEAEEAKIPIHYRTDRQGSLDHGSWVPLYFLARAGLATFDANETSLLLRPALLSLSISGLSAQVHGLYGECIARAIQKSGRRTAFIASGDLSHKLKADGPYGLAAEGELFEKEFERIVAGGDLCEFLRMDELLAESAAVCGLQSFQILAGLLGAQPYKTELLSHEGPYGVGYAVALFTQLHELGAKDHE